MTDESFKFTANELGSTAWAKLHSYIDSRISALRIKNDAELDELATARLRGQIVALKNLLALGNPDQAMVADDDGPE